MVSGGVSVQRDLYPGGSLSMGGLCHGNVRVVRILLECILVLVMVL